MDVRTRVTICRLLTFAQSNVPYSERCGIKDISYYKNSEDRPSAAEGLQNRNKSEGVLAMSKAYKKPGLCNYYCSKACPIGQEFVPAVELKGLTQIALEVLNSLNKLTKEKERLIEISVDGRISEDEIKDFARIRHELNSISATVDALQLWVSDTIAANGIDKAELDRLTGELME